MTIAKDFFEEGKHFLKDHFIRSRQKEYDDFSAAEAEKSLLKSKLRTALELITVKEQNLAFLREKLSFYKSVDFAVSVYSFITGTGASDASLSKAAEEIAGPYFLSQHADSILKIAADDLDAHRASLAEFKRVNSRLLKELGIN